MVKLLKLKLTAIKSKIVFTTLYLNIKTEIGFLHYLLHNHVIKLDIILKYTCKEEFIMKFSKRFFLLLLTMTLFLSPTVLNVSAASADSKKFLLSIQTTYTDKLILKFKNWHTSQHTTNSMVIFY